jgi:hypothetical protein
MYDIIPYIVGLVSFTLHYKILVIMIYFLLFVAIASTTCWLNQLAKVIATNDPAYQSLLKFFIWLTMIGSWSLFCHLHFKL